MYGYPKIWTALLDEEWFLSLNLLQRGAYLMLIMLAKKHGDCGLVNMRSFSHLGEYLGCEKRTARALVEHLASMDKVKFREISRNNARSVVVIEIKNYKKFQEMKEFEAGKITRLTETETETETEIKPPVPPFEKVPPTKCEKSGRTVSTSASAGIQELWKFWKEQHNHPNSILDDKRRRALERGIKLAKGDLEQAKMAVLGCASSDFHQGKNEGGKKYDDVTLIFRDAQHYERFVNLGAEAKRREWRKNRVRVVTPQAQAPPLSEAEVAKQKHAFKNFVSKIAG